MRNSKGQNATRARLLTCGATAAIVTACAFAVPVMAQDAAATTPAPADETTTVVVTGIRRGIQDAITAKKKSSQIVEAVSAEDIGKLPDASIAESIARLPGIAAQRTNGRAQTLSIRGLGPDFTLTTLNGREQVSTNDNRSVEFDQYPSELISQVVVYKTPNAGMTAQGLAGTADLQTVRPLAFGKKAFAVNVRGEVNSEDAAIGGMKNTGNRFSVMYIDQFANKTIGVALGYAHTDSPYQTQKKESWGFPTCSACATDDQDLLITGGEKDAVDSSNLTRDGYMAVVEFKPNDRFHLTLDGYHSDFDELQRIARLEYPLAWGANQLQSGYTTDDEFVTSGTFTGVKTVVENYINRRKAKLDSFGANATYDLNDQWSLLADLSTSKVVRDDTLVESTAGTGASGSGATDTITFEQQANGLTNLTGVVDYSDFDSVFLTDPGGWGGPTNRAGYVKIPHITDEIKAAKFAATRKIGGGLFSDISVGYNHTEHTKAKVGVEGYLTLKDGATAVVPEAYRTGTTDAQFLGSNSGMISYDALGLYESGFFGFVEDTTTASLQKTWSVTEKIDYAYIKANIDTTVFNIPLTGNIGLMSEHADQEATSRYTVGDGTFSTVTDGDNYTDVLPSMALNFALADDMTLRIGAGTTLARPRMDDMAAGTGYSVTVDGTTSGSTVNGHPVYWNSTTSGNPHLKPWKSNNYDISLEKYFGRKGYVSAALFYKDLTTFIYSDTTIHDYTGVALPSYCTSGTTSVCTEADAQREGLATQMNNGDGGYIKGVELTASVPGELLWAPLDGFGLIVSGAFNDSSINPKGTGAIDVPGLSKKVINTTIYYEKYGFSARLSNRYRGDFLGEVPNYTNTLENQWVHSESILDAQLGYAFQSGPLKGISLSFSAQNLTNEPFTLYQGKGQRDHILRQEKYGSSYLFGVNYRY
ncbi:MAG: TonB-dependent receptor [Asticcacaulis sp.]|uniref:TonB-dependent receptor n=1 Tax=Asticcacaulis sp. TaxID=1872648 RepID=UPI0039E589D4